MKKYTLANLIVLTLTFLTSPNISLAQAGQPHAPQATQPHFFIHGWKFPVPFTSGTNQVSDMASDMKARFGWAVNPVLPNYADIPGVLLCGIPCVDGLTFPIAGVHKQLLGQSQYVGLGYSMGGLFARYEAKQYGSGFITGLVTDHTPNDGVWMADFGHRASFVERWIDGQDGMLAGYAGFLWEVFGGLNEALEYVASFTGQFLNLIGTVVDGGLAQDATPGSSFLNSINGTQPAGVLREAVFGEVTNEPDYPAFTSDAYAASWVDAENQARQNSHDNDNLANGVHPHWWCPWKYLQAAWYRTLAGNWALTAHSMDDVEDDWEDNTAGRGVVSDAFVGVESQKAIPNPDFPARWDLPFFNVNHGSAVANNVTMRFNIQHALMDVGAR